jgi:hypothetical protein
MRTPIRLPIASPEEIIEAVWAGVGLRTRALFLSHHTSTTAMTVPVDVLCRRARAAGIRTIVDGAHVPGHLPLNLRELDADYYAGNCHKWLFHFCKTTERHASVGRKQRRARAGRYLRAARRRPAGSGLLVFETGCAVQAR